MDVKVINVAARRRPNELAAVAAGADGFDGDAAEPWLSDAPSLLAMLAPKKCARLSAAADHGRRVRASSRGHRECARHRLLRRRTA
jgi:hypothetical protein